MKGSKTKKLFAGFLSAMMIFSSSGISVYAANKTYEPGVTIKENTEFDSTDSEYMATFTYITDEDLEKVTVTGGFGFYTEEAAETYLENGSRGGITPVDPENFINDGSMFTTGHLVDPGGYAEITMTEVEDGVWTVDIPLPNGQYYYRYNLYRTGVSRYEQILDPANMPVSHGNNSSGWSLFYVGNAQNCLDGQEYIFPTDVNKGKVEYVTYEASDGSMQAMGVYLPYGYNESKTYKTLYLSHGSGGNEVEWFEIGSAKNIMDNLIAKGEVAETIVVTLDLTTSYRLGNSAPGNGFEEIQDNIMNYVIPYVEENYSVSTNASDRAFAGLSGGARLSTFLYQNYAGEFASFGMFSHTLSGVDVENIENNDFPTLMLGYGNLDPFGKQNFPDFTSRLDAAGIEYDLYDVNGGHDWGAWRTLLSIFVKDYLWDVEETYTPGYTVSENVDFSDIDVEHQVTFTYENDSAVKVELIGGFQFYSQEDVENDEAVNTNPLFWGATDLQPKSVFEYTKDLFPLGYVYGNGTNLAIEMKEVKDGVWSVTIPLASGEWFYAYNVYDLEDGEAVKTYDPVNMPVSNIVGEDDDHIDSGWCLAYVGDRNSKDILEGQEWVFPRTDGKQGTVSYVTYTAVDGSEQPMGVYLPYGYDKNKTYKTLYLSHGGGGNEVEWFNIGSANNIMDNAIAEGEVDDTIIITLSHEQPFGWNFDLIKENLMNNVIPYVEDNYSVSTDARDRAFAGLSAGGMTSSSVYSTLAGEFGYFGIWSYNVSVDVPNVENNDYPTMMLGYGKLDFGKSTYAAFMESLDAAGVDYDLYEINGGHDWGVWRNLLSKFVVDYLWEDTDKPANPGEVVVPVEPTDPTTPETPVNPGDSQEPTTPEDPTISIETPTTPNVPTNTTNTQSSTNTSVVSTGDQAQYMAYACLAFLSVLGVGYVLNVRRKKHQ